MSNVLYIIIPCYNEEEVLPEIVRILSTKLTSLTRMGLISQDSKVLLVDDGSSDKTWSLICRFHQQDSRFSGISLSRNRGQQNALLAGLMFAMDRCDMAISMDADLQDDVNTIDKMIARYLEGADIVYGVRSDRSKDSGLKRNTSWAFYKLMSMLGTETIYDHAEFRLMSKRALEGLSKFGEANLFLRGIIPMIGYNTDTVTYQRGERLAGESKYSFEKLLSLAVEAITSLSTKPLKMIGSIGFFVFLISVLCLLTGGIHKDSIKVMTGSVWCVGGLILLGLGVVGEYIGKIYLETKARPRYLIKEIKEKKE